MADLAKLVDELSSLTVLEAAELSKLLEAKWGVSAAAPVALLASRGLDYGRQTYGGYSDGDSSLSRAAWCTVLHTRPEIVIETGVARGVTSRIVLEALSANDRGHLWSIDLPHPFDRRLHPPN